MSKETINEMNAQMDKTVDVLRREYQKVRTGRASTALLDDIKIDYYGTMSGLSQVATLAVTPQLTVVLPPLLPRPLLWQ